MNPDERLRRERERMVDRQIAARGIRDPHVLEAMRTVPRHAFVADDLRHMAYDDRPLPIDAGQTISQPYIVALMTEAAGVAPRQRVLEVGTGSGYAAAVLSRIAAEVFTLDRHETLVADASARLAALGCRNIRLKAGDGTLGWPEAAPFDAIVVAAGGPEVPPALPRQLKVGGRLLIPIGGPGEKQRLLRVTRHGPDAFESDDLGPVAFVPLIGERGWREDG